MWYGEFIATDGKGNPDATSSFEGPIHIWNNTSTNGTYSVTQPYPEGDITPPPAPANLRATHVGTLGVTLAWDAVPDAYRYDVYRKDTIDNDWRYLGHVLAPANTYGDGHRVGSSLYDIHNGTGLLEPGKTYEYQVRAVDLSGERKIKDGSGNWVTVGASAPSNALQVTTAPASSSSAAVTLFQGNTWPEQPSATDQGQTAIKTTPQGNFRDLASPDLAVLFDGGVQDSNSQVAKSFFHKYGTDYNFLMDFGSVMQIDKINTFSWESSCRRFQLYAVYASESAAAPATQGDLEANGWRFVAWVDTYYAPAGSPSTTAQHLSRITGGGRARHLLFSLRSGKHIYSVDGREQLPAYYGEIDVFATDLTPPTTAPAAPASLATTGNTTTSVGLRWTDNSNNESSFAIERSTDNATWTALTLNPSNTVTYTDSSLNGGTTYYYRVRAINSVGNSAYTNVLTTTTQSPPAPPSAPSSLSATTVSHTAIDLSWSDSSTNESSFLVEWSMNNAEWTGNATAAANSTGYSVTGLAAATPYFFRVRTANSVGSSDYSDVAQATTADAPVPPTAPSGLAAAAASSSTVNVTWTHDGSNVSAFEVERSNDGVAWSQAGTTDPSTTYFSNTGLSALTQYYYRVRGVNSGTYSSFSATVSATTLAPTAPPEAPSGLAVSALSSNSLRLTWNDNSNDESGFKVERSTNNSTWTSVTTPAAGQVTFTDTALAASTLYYYRVLATNVAGDSANSASASAATQSASSVSGNILQNPSFETAGTGTPVPPLYWGSQSFMSRTTSVARTGTAAMQLIGDGNTATTSAYTRYPYPSVTAILLPSTAYEFTVWMRSDAVTGTGHGIRLWVVGPIALGSPQYLSAYQYANGSDWVQVKLTFTTPATAADGWGFRIAPLLSPGETVWVDDVAVAPVNQAPTGISLSAAAVNENSAAGTLVGTLAAVDGNSWDTHTFTLVSGAGDNDNSLFAIAGNALNVAAGVNYEATPACSVRIRATDAAGAAFEKAFSITIANLPETPYELWAQTKFGTGWTNTAVAGASVPGTDGIPNLLRYALNLPDTVTGQQGMPTVAAEGGNVAFTYEVDTAKSDITYTPESSTDLVTWTPVATRTKLSASETLETWKASVAPGANNRAFFRLKVAR